MLQFSVCINKTIEFFGFGVDSKAFQFTLNSQNHTQSPESVSFFLDPGLETPSIVRYFRLDEAIYMNNFLSIKLVSGFVDIVIVPLESLSRRYSTDIHIYDKAKLNRRAA